jgi:hypothetical protein
MDYLRNLGELRGDRYQLRSRSTVDQVDERIIELDHLPSTLMALHADKFELLHRPRGKYRLNRRKPQVGPARRILPYADRMGNVTERTQDNCILAILVELRRELTYTHFRPAIHLLLYKITGVALGHWLFISASQKWNCLPSKKQGRQDDHDCYEDAFQQVGGLCFWIVFIWHFFASS